MQRADYVIAAVALVALVGSLLGVALYDEPEFRRYDVRVITHTDSENVGSLSLTGPGADDDLTWDLTTQNITTVTFTIDITGGATGTLRPDPTQVQVDLVAPNSEDRRASLSLSGTGEASDQATVTFTFHDLPLSHDRVLARNAEAAGSDGEDPRIPTGLNATGTWIVEAAITSGGGGALGLSPETVTVRVSVEFEYYSALATLHLPDPGPVA